MFYTDGRPQLSAPDRSGKKVDAEAWNERSMPTSARADDRTDIVERDVSRTGRAILRRHRIRIGNLMPYTGNLAEFGAIGKAEAAYFDMINARDGINDRKIRFISRDDNSDPTVALDLTRGLVERDNVHLMFGSFGTPGNLAYGAS